MVASGSNNHGCNSETEREEQRAKPDSLIHDAERAKARMLTPQVVIRITI